MIKISLRPNLIYPIFLIIWTFLRKIISILISKLFSFKGSVIYTFLMFLGELIAGFSFYRYQENIIEEKSKKNDSKNTIYYKNISLIESDSKIKRHDHIIKFVFLIFMTGSFDFFEFILSTYYISKFHKISGTLQTRLGGVLMIISSLLYWFLLKFQMFKHQIFSIIILVLSVIILIISEFLFQTFDMILTVENLSLVIFFSILSHMCVAFNNTIEKYLIDFDFLNPLLLLSYQGIIGIFFTIICGIYENPFPALKNVYNNNSIGMFILFLVMLLFYTIFGALKNVYRMFTIMLFTPMNKHLADISVNPIYIIYYFSMGEDFKINDQINYFYFFLNLFLLILFDICGLIFNEFLILLCCGLEFYTYRSISFRAETTIEMGDIFEPETDEQETDE